MDGFMYSLGGNDGSSSLNSVERYDPQLDKWTIVSSMVTRRSSIGASVLECFNFDKGLVKTTNLWRLATMGDSDASGATATAQSTTANGTATGKSNLNGGTAATSS